LPITSLSYFPGAKALPRPITVKIKKLDAMGSDVPAPMQMTEHAAGFDLCAAVEKATVLKPGEIKVIPCGFAMAVPHGYEAQVRPRSGLSSKFGVTMINAPGTIDSDYRGEVMVPLVNHGRKKFTIERGMRIAQMLILPVPKVKIVEVKTLDDTRRGKGGFGHTGH
jgi:dUTP pyrophosphatase